MKNKLISLLVVLGTLCALGAALASTASAANEMFRSELEHTIYDAQAVSNWEFGTFAGKIPCTSLSFDNATTTKKEVKELTVTPTFGGCKEGAGRTVDVRMNGCDFLLTSEIPAGEKHAPMHIKCAKAGEAVELKITTIFGEKGCVKIPPQTPTGGLVYANGTKNGKADWGLLATLSSIEYSLVELCGNELRNDGTLTGEATVSGTDTNGLSIGIEWK